MFANGISHAETREHNTGKYIRTVMHNNTTSSSTPMSTTSPLPSTEIIEIDSEQSSNDEADDSCPPSYREAIEVEQKQQYRGQNGKIISRY